MSNEKMNQMIGEAYENFINTYKSKNGEIILPPFDYIDNNGVIMSKEQFITNIKYDYWFSKKWGLKIEERELDMIERWELADLTPNMTEFDYCNKLCDEHNVPIKLITATYHNETIESYE